MPQISGLYPSELTTAHYQELLALLQQDMLAGELSGGALFTAQTLQALEVQSLDFTLLPAVTAYSRAMIESLLRPLALLSARYGAFSRESQRFAGDMQRYFRLLSADLNLVERELSQVYHLAWIATLPSLPNSVVFSYSLAAEHPVQALPSILPAGDPYNQEIVPLDPGGAPLYPDTGRWLLTNGVWSGMAGHVLTRRTTGNINLKWNLLHPSAPPAALEIRSGDAFDWTTCNFLLDRPVMNLLPPITRVLSPAQQESAPIVRVRGESLTGTLPVFLRLTFCRRSQTIGCAPQAEALTFTLSANNVAPDSIVVFSDTRSYQQGIDYQLALATNNNTITFLPTTLGQTLTILFVEYAPAYQCSISNQNWSPLLLFDPQNPWADPVAEYLPLRIVDGWFPLFDESGRALGLEIQLTGPLTGEYLLESACAADGNFEALAELSIDLETPGYFDAIVLDPQSEFPMSLKKISYEGFQTGQPITVWVGSQTLDQPLTARLTDPARPVFCRRMTLTFGQENYSLETATQTGTGDLRQNALSVLQTSIPFASRDIPAATPRQKTGYQYSFGLQNIHLEASQYFTGGNTVLPCGPFSVAGAPRAVLFQATGSDTASNSVKGHLYFQLYDANGVAYPVSPVHILNESQTVLFSTLAPSLPAGFAGAISKVDFYLKLVLFGPTVLTQFHFQVGL